ncbi:hypothetical protein AAK967_06510 [Atopobiaceae bacterium 24-176]
MNVNVVRTTVVISSTKEGAEWANVTVNDSCNQALELIPDTIRVFDPEGNDVTEQCLKFDPATQKITLDIPAVAGGAFYTLRYDALVTGYAVSNDSADTKTMKVLGGSSTVRLGGTVQYTIVAGNLCQRGEPVQHRLLRVREALGAARPGDARQARRPGARLSHRRGRPERGGQGHLQLRQDRRRPREH